MSDACVSCRSVMSQERQSDEVELPHSWKVRHRLGRRLLSSLNGIYRRLSSKASKGWVLSDSLLVHLVNLSGPEASNAWRADV